MGEDTIRTGHCLCGAVRFAAQGEPRWVAHCHCESCRRATSSPLTTYAGYLATQVSWQGEKPARYESSPGVERSFCSHCGAPMSFASKKWPEELHLFAAAFDNPAALIPTVHVHVGEQLPWLHLADDLPRFVASGGDA